jgi:hypothetical protein
MGRRRRRARSCWRRSAASDGNELEGEQVAAATPL